MHGKHLELHLLVWKVLYKESLIDWLKYKNRRTYKQMNSRLMLMRMGHSVHISLKFNVQYLASLALSSAISRVSCRFVSSHWAMLRSRVPFCSLSCRCVCLNSATVPNRSFHSLREARGRSMCTGQSILIGQNSYMLTAWSCAAGPLHLLSCCLYSSP